MWVHAIPSKGGQAEKRNNSAQEELTQRDRKTAFHPAPPGDRTQGLWVRILTSDSLTTELRPPSERPCGVRVR